jgi:peptidoglycan hydrolase-like protein with peptidoglycan-binding domain
MARDRQAHCVISVHCSFLQPFKRIPRVLLRSLACLSVQKVDEATGKKTVWAILSDGRRFQGDVLIGADGIWSKVLGPSYL